MLGKKIPQHSHVGKNKAKNLSSWETRRIKMSSWEKFIGNLACWVKISVFKITYMLGKNAQMTTSPACWVKIK